MTESYVLTKRYHYWGRFSNRRSHKMYPVTYGPFDTPEAAKQWAEQKGVMHYSITDKRETDNITPGKWQHKTPEPAE